MLAGCYIHSHFPEFELIAQSEVNSSERMEIEMFGQTISLLFVSFDFEYVSFRLKVIGTVEYLSLYLYILHWFYVAYVALATRFIGAINRNKD